MTMRAAGSSDYSQALLAFDRNGRYKAHKLYKLSVAVANQAYKQTPGSWAVSGAAASPTLGALIARC